MRGEHPKPSLIQGTEPQSHSNPFLTKSRRQRQGDLTNSSATAGTNGGTHDLGKKQKGIRAQSYIRSDTTLIDCTLYKAPSCMIEGSWQFCLTATRTSWQWDGPLHIEVPCHPSSLRRQGFAKQHDLPRCLDFVLHSQDLGVLRCVKAQIDKARTNRPDGLHLFLCCAQLVTWGDSYRGIDSRCEEHWPAHH